MESLKKSDLQFKKHSDSFYQISDDQAHEENNKVIKGSANAIGISDSPICLAKLMITGPELARMKH